MSTAGTGRARERGGRRRDPRIVLTLLLAVAAAVLALVPDRPVGADATAPTVLAATLEHHGGAIPTPDVGEVLEARVGDAIALGTLSHGPLTVIAGEDPLSVDPFLACHLRRELERWSEVGAVWTSAREQLGDDLDRCDPADDTPCGLELRLRLQTQASLLLAARTTCDADCARRLEAVQERLERTTESFAALAPEALDPGVDTAALLDEAVDARDVLAERIRTADTEGGDEECEA